MSVPTSALVTLAYARRAQFVFDAIVRRCRFRPSLSNSARKQASRRTGERAEAIQDHQQAAIGSNGGGVGDAN